MSLEIEIEPNAYICQSCQISLGDFDTSAESPASTPKTKLIISGGNVFHPRSRLTISRGSIDADIDITVTIGPNNLFEEESHCIIDLSNLLLVSKNGNENDDYDDKKNNGKHTNHSAIGSYNQISAGAELKFTSMGNANIFFPKCYVAAPTIQNGNIFQACYDNRVRTPIHSDEADLDDSQTIYQEKVCYLSGDFEESDLEPEVEKPSHSCNRKIRHHKNGVKRNIVEVSSLLNVAKRVLQKHHRLMAVKNTVD
jgi:hypothetical protein